MNKKMLIGAMLFLSLTKNVQASCRNAYMLIKTAEQRDEMVRNMYQNIPGSLVILIHVPKEPQNSKELKQYESDARKFQKSLELVQQELGRAFIFRTSKDKNDTVEAYLKNPKLILSLLDRLQPQPKEL